jgi:hypothetical protein
MSQQALDGRPGSHARLNSQLKWAAAAAILPLIPVLVWAGAEVMMAVERLLSGAPL